MQSSRTRLGGCCEVCRASWLWGVDTEQSGVGVGGDGCDQYAEQYQQGQGGLVEAGARGGEEPLYQFPSWTN